MKLFYLPGACSMASHIVLNEMGKPFTLVKVDPKNRTTDEGEDYLSINPNGYVPALRLADGQVLTENIALLTFLADGSEVGQLSMPSDRLERARLVELLSFLTAELHKSFSPFFADPKPEGSALADALSKLHSRIGHVEHLLGDGRPYLTGDTFTVADAYAFVILNWSGFIGEPLDRWPRVEAYTRRVAERPAVQKALRTEGLVAA